MSNYYDFMLKNKILSCTAKRSLIFHIVCSLSHFVLQTATSCGAVHTQFPDKTQSGQTGLQKHALSSHHLRSSEEELCRLLQNLWPCLLFFDILMMVH